MSAHASIPRKPNSLLTYALIVCAVVPSYYQQEYFFKNILLWLCMFAPTNISNSEDTVRIFYVIKICFSELLVLHHTYVFRQCSTLLNYHFNLGNFVHCFILRMLLREVKNRFLNFFFFFFWGGGGGGGGGGGWRRKVYICTSVIYF